MFYISINIGGGKRARTADPLRARQVLSQLSYTPTNTLPFYNPPATKTLVGLGRFELPTSRLSGVRSNHLSYRPIKTATHVLSINPLYPHEPPKPHCTSIGKLWPYRQEVNFRYYRKTKNSRLSILRADLANTPALQSRFYLSLERR